MSEYNWPLPIVPKNSDGRAGKNKVTVGQVFGRLQVISLLGENAKGGGTKCSCACSCGTVKVVKAAYLNTGETRSCGCLRVDTTIARSTKHGHSPASGASKTYWVWAEMVARCTNKKHKRYLGYGGRGVFVCEPWLKFSGFVKDMGEKPEGLSIERIDNNGGYEPSNCRWATIAEQCHNKRNNSLSWGIVKTLRALDLPYKELEKRFGIYHGTIGKVKRNEIWVDPDYVPSHSIKGNSTYV
jgi:hypothetical protein